MKFNEAFTNCLSHIATSYGNMFGPGMYFFCDSIGNCSLAVIPHFQMKSGLNAQIICQLSVPFKFCDRLGKCTDFSFHCGRSTSVVDNATMCCLADFQLTGTSAIFIIMPVVDFLESRSEPQSASVYASSCEVFCGAISRHRSSVRFRYLSILFTASQCACLGSATCRLKPVYCTANIGPGPLGNVI